MSVSRWSYDPVKCDGDFCPGECDLCSKKDEEPSELDRLEHYLKENNMIYKRFDVHEEFKDDYIKGLVYILDRHQICVPDDYPKCEWDAVCHEGSIGFEEGLLEIYGKIVKEDEGKCVGLLTAEDVIKRIEENAGQNKISQ